MSEYARNALICIAIDVGLVITGREPGRVFDADMCRELAFYGLQDEPDYDELVKRIDAQRAERSMMLADKEMSERARSTGQDKETCEMHADENGKSAGASMPDRHLGHCATAAIEWHTIGWAVKQMHGGQAVRRRGWNGRGMFVKLQVPDVHSKMSLPYVFMRTAQGELVPWLCSQTDLLATDWEFFEASE